MLRRAATTVLAALALALPSAKAGTAAAASLGFTSCPNLPSFSCGTLPVPLDRSGRVPGTIDLSVERRPCSACAAPSQDAVLALAGGPGQAALPLGEFVARTLAPALSSRDLLLFDQRGTGSSDPLQCAALETLSAKALAALYEQCALQIGPARGAFTSAESVEDIEAVRRAAGYEKLVLYATSYGTKVALQYAQRYPDRVAALVLDSVVPETGKEPFPLTSFAAIRPVLAELCGHGACAGITADALADLARLAAQVRRHALSGSVYDGAGRRHTVSLTEAELFTVLLAGDLNPALRALLPAAVRSALAHDPDPLLRLELLAEGLIPSEPARAGVRAASEASPQRGLVPHEPPSAGIPAASEASPQRTLIPHEPPPAGIPAASEASLQRTLIPHEPPPAGIPAASEASPQIDEALFADTSCEETPFPWQRSAPPSTRLREAIAALHAQPPAALYPFDYATALQDSLVEECARWPDASPPPPTPGALPDVPTLLLSGAQDLRTPTANARAVAAAIPDAQLLVVPFTGHSVLGSDLSGCAARAVSAFFAGAAVQPCPATTDQFSPTPVTPRSLASVHAPHALPGRPGQTLVAALDTLVDLNRQLIGATIQADRELPAGSSFGGLRGGYARLTASALVLRRFAFVPGVELTGAFPVKGGRLQPATIHVGGAVAASGSMRIGSGFKRAAGTLGGRRFSIAVAQVHLSSRAGGGEWPSPAIVRRLLGASGLR